MLCAVTCPRFTHNLAVIVEPVCAAGISSKSAKVSHSVAEPRRGRRGVDWADDSGGGAAPSGAAPRVFASRDSAAGLWDRVPKAITARLMAR